MSLDIGAESAEIGESRDILSAFYIRQFVR